MPLPMAPPMISPSERAVSKRGGTGEPSPKQHHRRGLEGEQHPLPERPVLLEQAVADALVPGQHEIEEGGKAHGALGLEVKDIEHPELRGLVEERRNQRRNDDRGGSAAPQT